MTLAELCAQAEQITQGVELKSEFAPVPPGEYEVTISDVAKANDANGMPLMDESGYPVDVLDGRGFNPTNPNEHNKYMRFTLTITSGEYQGRYLYMNNNIIVFPKDLSQDAVTRAQKAMAIGRKERDVMMRAKGVAVIQHAADLIGASFRAKTKVTKDMNGKDRAEVSAIMDLSSSASKMPSTAFAQTPANLPTTATYVSTEALNAVKSASAQPAPAARAKLPWEK